MVKAVRLPAEAVEKGIPREHFFPDVCLHRSTQNQL